MDRIIKFRGFNEELNKWLYGSLIKMNCEYSDKEFFILPAMRLVDFKHDAFCSLIREVAPESVGQFTELLDKDGKEIYEGDILLFSNQLALRIVLWEDSYAKFEFHLLNKSPQPCGYTLCKGNANVIEIVGNIYENHELLETKND